MNGSLCERAILKLLMSIKYDHSYTNWIKMTSTDSNRNPPGMRRTETRTKEPIVSCGVNSTDAPTIELSNISCSTSAILRRFYSNSFFFFLVKAFVNGTRNSLNSKFWQFLECGAWRHLRPPTFIIIHTIFFTSIGYSYKIDSFIFNYIIVIATW